MPTPREHDSDSATIGPAQPGDYPQKFSINVSQRLLRLPPYLFGRINALKQSISLFVNVAAACVFVFSGRIDWPVAGVMFVCALAGGLIGGKFAAKLPAKWLRWLVVVLGVALSIVYFVRL